MRTEIIDCDCCRRKNIGKSFKTIMPIITKDLKSKKEYLTEKEMDLCVECANRFSMLYYEIAQEHGGTGIRGII